MILHVSAQRFCCRNRVARVVALWGAKSARETYKGSDGTANFGLLRDPSFLTARMRASMYLFAFKVISKKYHAKDLYQGIPSKRCLAGLDFQNMMKAQPSKRSLVGYALQKIFSGVGFSKYDESATLQKIFSGVLINSIPPRRSLARCPPKNVKKSKM